LYHAFRIWESPVIIRLRSCYPDYVVTISDDLLLVNLGDIVLAILGVRALTEEELLYIRLYRLGKYFFTGEEICT
jgi:hypothetical protein